jgi:hypothetical protein
MPAESVEGAAGGEGWPLGRPDPSRTHTTRSAFLLHQGGPFECAQGQLAAGWFVESKCQCTYLFLIGAEKCPDSR